MGLFDLLFTAAEAGWNELRVELFRLIFTTVGLDDCLQIIFYFFNIKKQFTSKKIYALYMN